VAKNRRGQLVNPPPTRIGGATVLCYTPIDDRHRHTGNCRQVVAGVLQSAAAGLAICRYDDSEDYYLFGCDGSWRAITDTCQRTLKEAKGQAEFEFEGVSSTWVACPPDGSKSC
jgi:hypothetical protein